MPSSASPQRGRSWDRTSRRRSHSKLSSSSSSSRSSSRDHRKRPRPSHSSDEESSAHKKRKPSKKDKKKPKESKSEPEKHWLQDKGRIYGRYVDMWGHVDAMLNDGFARDSDLEDDDHTTLQNSHYNMYCDLVKMIPRLPDEIIKAGPQGTAALAKLIDAGRKSARGSDVHGFKHNIHRWREFEPAYQVDAPQMRGFHHPTCGLLLCPGSMDWNDDGVRRGLRDGTIKAKPDDFPRLLYRQETINQEDLFDGFLRNQLLVKGYLYIFQGPSAAKQDGKDGSRRKSISATHNIRHVNLPSISYVAALAHFALSSQHTFHAGGNNGGKWPYRQFYRDILSVAASMDKDDRKDLLDWWDDQVFGDVEPESENVDENTEPACLSMAARMKMQAAAAAKEKAAIKVHNVAAATEEHQPQFSNGGNGLMDVTNTGPGAVTAAPAGAAASQA